jgi:succinate-acetate transporter protein
LPFGSLLKILLECLGQYPKSSADVGSYSVGDRWGILTFIFFVQTLRINRSLQTLFFSLAALFFLLAGGVRSPICNKVMSHMCVVQS